MRKSKGSANIGNGVITPTQIAFIVDRYLCDNRFSKTRTLFRTEASSLLSNSPVRDVLKSYLTLEDILKDYVSLREQRMVLDQERVVLDNEKIRVQNLLQGMQNVMNTYNTSLTSPPPPPVGAPAPQHKKISSSGCIQNNTPNVMSVSLLGNKRVNFGNFSTPLASHRPITGKRKGHENSVGAPPVARRARIATAQDSSTANETNRIRQADRAANNFSSQTPPETLALAKNSSANEFVTRGGSSVAGTSLPTNSTCLRTPQKHATPGSDKFNSPQREVTPTNCTIVTKERFTISPLKQITSYTMERSHLISSSPPVKSNLKVSNKRGHVKGRLNFDDTEATMNFDAPASGDFVSSSSSGSEAEADLFDLLSENFPFSDVLVDFDIGCEGMPDPCLPQPLNCHIETASGSSPQSLNGNLVPDQVVSEYTSTVTEMGKDMNTQGSDSMTTVKSITKCLRILSPAKSCRQRSHN